MVESGLQQLGVHMDVAAGKVLRFLLLLPLESSQLEYTLLWKIDLGLRTCMCIRSTRCLMVHAI